MTAIPTPEKALELYQPLVEGNEQAIPILTYATAEQIIPIGIGGLPAGGIQPALRTLFEALKPQYGQPQWLLLSMEAWMKESQSRKLEPGQLQREAEAGSTEVRECVQILGVTADGLAFSLTAPFERHDDGSVTWHEADVASRTVGSDPNFGGAVVDILFHAVR